MEIFTSTETIVDWLDFFFNYDGEETHYTNWENLSNCALHIRCFYFFSYLIGKTGCGFLRMFFSVFILAGDNLTFFNPRTNLRSNVNPTFQIRHFFRIIKTALKKPRGGGVVLWVE